MFRKKTIIFLHVPKAAGSTVNWILLIEEHNPWIKNSTILPARCVTGRSPTTAKITSATWRVSADKTKCTAATFGRFRIEDMRVCAARAKNSSASKIPGTPKQVRTGPVIRTMLKTNFLFQCIVVGVFCLIAATTSAIPGAPGLTASKCSNAASAASGIPLRIHICAKPPSAPKWRGSSSSVW